jgi:hypothetical protein
MDCHTGNRVRFFYFCRTRRFNGELEKKKPHAPGIPVTSHGKIEGGPCNVELPIPQQDDTMEPVQTDQGSEIRVPEFLLLQLLNDIS